MEVAFGKSKLVAEAAPHKLYPQPRWGIQPVVRTPDWGDEARLVGSAMAAVSLWPAYALEGQAALFQTHACKGSHWGMVDPSVFLCVKIAG